MHRKYAYTYMSVYVCMRIHEEVCIQVYEGVCMYEDTLIRIPWAFYAYKYMSVYVCMLMYVWMYTYIHPHILVCIHMYIHICIHMYIHIPS